MNEPSPFLQLAHYLAANAFEGAGFTDRANGGLGHGFGLADRGEAANEHARPLEP